MILQELIAVLGFETKGEQNIKKFEDGLKSAERGLTTFKAAVVGVAAGLAMEFGRAIGNAVNEMANPFKLASDAAGPLDQLVKMRDRVGENFEALQEWQFAAGQSGASAGEFQSSVESMTRQLAEAARGTGRAKLALEDYGMSATRSNGDIKQSTEFLLELADKFEGLNEAQQLDLGRKLGLSPGMISLLKTGREEIDKLHAQARDGGLVFSEEDARNAERYNDALSYFQQSIRAIRHYLGVQLLPVLADTLDTWQSWFNVNRDMLRTGIDRGFRFVQHLGSQFMAVGRGAYYAAAGMVDLVSRITGLDKVASAGVLGAGLLGSTQLGRGLMVALARRIPAVGAFLLIDEILTGLRGGDTFIGKLEGGQEAIDSLREKFSGLGQAITDVADALKLEIDWSAFETPSDLLNSELVKFVEDLNKLVAELTAVFSAIATGIEEVRRAINSPLEDTVDRILGLDGPGAGALPAEQRMESDNEKRRKSGRVSPQSMSIDDRINAAFANFEGNMAKMQGAAPIEAIANDNRVDNRQYPVTVNSTVNQTIQQPSAAPAAVGAATNRAVAGAAPPAARLITGNAR